MSKTTTTTDIPYALDDLKLNLRAFLDLPPRAVTLEEEVLTVLDGLRTRTCSREEAKDKLLRIIGREQDAFESAVKRALFTDDGE